MSLGWLIKQSLILDFKFIRVSHWSFFKKVIFILTKYMLVIKHVFRKFELGRDSVNLFGEKVYYDSRYGITDYQSILTRHQNMLNIAGITDIENVIDIGANVGFFSKLMRELYSKAHIYSIEPIPTVYGCLQSNLDKDIYAKQFNLAIYDKTDKVKMNFDSNDSAVSQINESGEIEVQADTLDNFIYKNVGISKIDILKIDTETFEAHVLRKGQKALSLTKYLFIEITLEDNPNYTMSSLMKLLSSDEFDFQLVAFRNYNNKGEGKMPIMDCLLVNLKINND